MHRPKIKSAVRIGAVPVLRQFLLYINPVQGASLAIIQAARQSARESTPLLGAPDV